MEVTARRATPEDVGALVELYRGLEAEMVALHPMWPLADGLAEPVADTIARLVVTGEDTVVVVGEIDGAPLGFLVGQVEGLLPQGEGEWVGSIRLVYVEEQAREVAVAELMRDLALEEFRRREISKFDAHVLPGHRLAKNFFEAGGFSARSIVMHHDDHRPPRSLR